MPINQMFLGEFDHEMVSTRKTLERIPEDKLQWQPHQKSMTLGRLASHLADIPGWIEHTFAEDHLDINPPGGQNPETTQCTTRQQMLDIFDRNVTKGRAALAAATDDQFQKPWSLLNGGKNVFTLPRAAVLRGFVMNHLIHHRAQLGVYLRLNDVPVPSVYGPSADESAF